ncbi:hypothetical protein JHK86_030671 [Glycine max]|nr:hypothetical protein JHK86_030671 [Glycine max]
MNYPPPVLDVKLSCTVFLHTVLFSIPYFNVDGLCSFYLIHFMGTSAYGDLLFVK